MMGSRVQVFLLVISIQILLVAAQTNKDFAVLKSLKDIWDNTPPNWEGPDPCGNVWVGIWCNNSRVTAITLGSIGLTGNLSGDISSLSELQILDLSYNKDLTGPLTASVGSLKKLINLNLVGCSFSGQIPGTIGSLQQLLILSLNSNRFTGLIPPEIGYLSNLLLLDLSDNKLSGRIPVSDGTTPGLDMLVNTKHFHFGKNQLSGTIPPKLFSPNMSLIHVLFDNNNLSGSIPSTLGLLQGLEVLRLDRNLLTGPVPSNLNKLVQVSELDMSNNTFDESDIPPWFSTLQSLTTLEMENTQLKGQVPVSLFSLPLLQTVVLRNNQLSGTLDVGSSYSGQLQIIDFQNNLIVAFVEGSGFKNKLILAGNPVCNDTEETKTYCSIQQSNPTPYSTPEKNCMPSNCSINQISSPNCVCAYPYTGNLYFRAPSFSDLGNSSIYTSLEDSLMQSFLSHQLPVDTVSLSNPTKNDNDYLVLRLEAFPSGEDHFNRTGISAVACLLSNQIFQPPKAFGSFYFNADSYGYFAESAGHRKSSNIGIIIGAAAGGSVLLLALLVGIYAFRQKRRAEIADKQNNPFAAWDPRKDSGDVPRLKGARSFSFEELKKCTNNFSDASVIGSGGYGKVYKGVLHSGRLVAVKRAQHRSMQGGLEFKSEIEMLSRVHHKNVVSLVGFCFEHDEQMLVYEYIPNGTLKESLSGKSGVRLDWTRRLRIALGAARGLQYLHELANPPIIHRDIKSNNILLDERLTAKVADFGLSKLMGDPEKGHVTTQVKGTMGYMDPEYYMTQQLTNKSDIYSFGVVMLELVTARQPIEKGKYIVREVKQYMDKTKLQYNLQEILDPSILVTPLKGLEKFVDLALSCVEDARAERPEIGDVVKEIENIMQIAGLNPNADSASASSSYEAVSKGYNHPYSDESLFVYSGPCPPSNKDPQ